MGLRGLRRSPRANGDLGRAEEFLCESRSPQARDQLAEWPVPSVAPEQVEELPARDAIPPQTQTRSACARQPSSRWAFTLLLQLEVEPLADVVGCAKRRNTEREAWRWQWRRLGVEVTAGARLATSSSSAGHRSSPTRALHERR
jgi:hypothetical protein